MTLHFNWFGKIYRLWIHRLEYFELEEYKRWKECKRKGIKFEPYHGR